ncbi:MAG: FAD-dependent oxidoreductase [Candidatus Gastranaerophilales bacterium]|nr:FAD-dependent oxidoreductase [Candidatus Gastranaerophilales bacterium]
MKNKTYDVIIFGGGLSGCACAFGAAEKGLKVLIVEKLTFLGGSATGGLVFPMMKNQLQDGTDLNSGFFKELTERLQKNNGGITFKDGNKGWFNPEVLKYTLDEYCEELGVEVLFDSVVTSAETTGKQVLSAEIFTCGQKFSLKSKYFVDATGNADFSSLCGVDFENGDNGKNQAFTLRFIMSNIDMEEFAQFLESLDDEKVSPVYRLDNGEIHLSTAYTYDDKDWKLKPFFEEAVKNGDLTFEDTAYFQIFTIPAQPASIGFNCPRISSSRQLNPLNPDDISFALMQGRSQIRRLERFCKKYLPGFKKAYVSQSAPMLGVRDSRRIKGSYILNEEDILNCTKFKDAVAKSNYPIDVHSYHKNKGELRFVKENDYYEIPVECTLNPKYTNLLTLGRAISATFLAQASLRIMPNCISTGENAADYICKKLQS